MYLKVRNKRAPDAGVSEKPVTAFRHAEATRIIGDGGQDAGISALGGVATYGLDDMTTELIQAAHDALVNVEVPDSVLQPCRDILAQRHGKAEQTGDPVAKPLTQPSEQGLGLTGGSACLPPGAAPSAA